MIFRVYVYLPEGRFRLWPKSPRNMLKMPFCHPKMNMNMEDHGIKIRKIYELIASSKKKLEKGRCQFDALNISSGLGLLVDFPDPMCLVKLETEPKQETSFVMVDHLGGFLGDLSWCDFCDVLCRFPFNISLNPISTPAPLPRAKRNSQWLDLPYGNLT